MKQIEQRNELDGSFLRIIFHLKNNPGGVILNFGQNDIQEIVPQQLTHDELIKNKIIADSILDYYYTPTSQWITDEVWKNLTNSGYHAERRRGFDPYSVNIFGAYHYRNDLLTKLSYLGFSGKMPTIAGNKNLNAFSDLSPYFVEYAIGFKEGFDGFENNQITPLLSMLSDKHDHSMNVFDFLTNRVFLERDWINNHGGFAVKGFPDGKNEICLIEAKKEGQKQGEFYRAWSIVFSNNHLFAPLFLNMLSPQQKEALPPPLISIEIRPNIEVNAANQFFNILKEYFEIRQHTELKTILQKGSNAKQKLIFKGNANQLTDAFKQLYNAHLLTGCQKKDLQKWLIDNFQYLNNKKEVMNFNDKTVEKSISGKEYHCKNPIIDVADGKVVRA